MNIHLYIFFTRCKLERKDSCARDAHIILLFVRSVNGLANSNYMIELNLPVVMMKEKKNSEKMDWIYYCLFDGER